MSGGQASLYCYPKGNRADLANELAGQFCRDAKTCCEGNSQYLRHKACSKMLYRNLRWWLAAKRFLNNSESPAMWVFWKVEDDGTIMRRAFNNKQRLEGDKTGSLRLAGRRCLPNSWESQTHSDSSWFDKILNQFRSLARNNFTLRVAQHIRRRHRNWTRLLTDLLWKVIQFLSVAWRSARSHAVLGTLAHLLGK